ncbi:MAG: deoxyribose-phosphate aldolase [Flavobacteriaceae bacterium]
MKSFYVIFCVLFIYSCNPTKKEMSAQEIIDNAIAYSGVDMVANATISFNFRDKLYISDRNNGAFSLKRITKNDTVVTKDILSNDGFKRFIDDIAIKVIDSMAIKYSESINSVHYFATLPFGLNDKAVNKKLLQEKNIKGKEYYKVEITFQQEGGGIDYQDVFIYWIEKEDFSIDYLAYKFHVDGGGVRFREVTNVETVNGIKFSNYNNYKPKDSKVRVFELDDAFENEELIKLSEINLENTKVLLKK